MMDSSLRVKIELIDFAQEVEGKAREEPHPQREKLGSQFSVSTN